MKVKILVLRSNPADTSALQLDDEVRGIPAELERPISRDRLEFIHETAIRADDRFRSLLNQPEAKLQKAPPDCSTIDRIAASKTALGEALRLSEPVATVTLIAAAEVG